MRPDGWTDYDNPYPIAYVGSYFEQAIVSLWMNAPGYNWMEIFLQLEGIKHIQLTVNQHIDELNTLQLVALERHKHER